MADILRATREDENRKRDAYWRDDSAQQDPDPDPTPTSGDCSFDEWLFFFAT